MTGTFFAFLVLGVAYFGMWWLGRHPAQVIYEDYVRSAAWRQRARDCKTRAGWRCEGCGSKNDLQAHHRTYARLGRERPSDLVCLCDGCHRAEHGLD